MNLPDNISQKTIVSWKVRYLKNATREIDRSSLGVREDENMERSTAGVTGIRDSDVGCFNSGGAWDLGAAVEKFDFKDAGGLG